MLKVLWLRSEQCLGPYTMLLFEGSSEIGLFRHLSNNIFAIGNFGNTLAMRVIFF